MGRWIKAGALIFVAALVIAGCEGASGVKGDPGDAGQDGQNGMDGMDGTDGKPGPRAMGFAYVAYDLTGVGGADEASPVGTLPIPFAAPDVLRADEISIDDMNPGTVTQSQCVAITSINYTARYMAFGGTGTVEYSIGMSQTTTMDDVMTTESFDGHMFTVDMSKAMSFGGMPNVLAGTYSYMLNAADSYDPAQEGSREWALAVTSESCHRMIMLGIFGTTTACMVSQWRHG